jgi:hypothetical protein
VSFSPGGKHGRNVRPRVVVQVDLRPSVMTRSLPYLDRSERTSAMVAII